jgi:hypothetical protein
MLRHRRYQRASYRPAVEVLERRWVPTTLIPTTFADGGLGSGSLRDAVLQFNADAGTDDDIIQLLAGTYTLTIRNSGGHHETAGLEGDLNLTQTSHRWIIQGAGSSGENATVIDASQLQDRVFQIVTPGTQVVFQDLVIQGGLAQDDGANGALAGSNIALGGGLLNNRGDVTLTNVVLQNNLAQGGHAASLGAEGLLARGGGVYSTGGSLDLVDSILANNQAIGGRGGDHNGVLRAGDGGDAVGAGLYATGGSLSITNSMIGSNLATGGRGGDGSFVTTSGYGNGASGGDGQGGGLYVNGASLTIASSTIASNQATGGLAGLYGGGGFGYAAGLVNDGTLTVTGSTLAGNAASYTGGGIYNGGTLTVSNSTLSGNSAARYGGGGYGGGIYNRGTLTVTGSTLTGNTAFAFGGGIDNASIISLTVSNSTLSGNTAGLGGGIFEGGFTLTVTGSTLSGNTGGGLWVVSSFEPPVLHNTVIAGNFGGGTTREDVGGFLNAGGDHNLIGDGSGMTGLQNGVNGNLVGSASVPIDPLLGPLTDNGGPTKTMALLAGSPALNAGEPAQLGVPDQRGVIRTGGVNIGAYQASATAFLVNAPDTVQPGVPFDVTVTAVDPFNQVAVGYTGTVTFNTNDPDPGVGAARRLHLHAGRRRHAPLYRHRPGGDDPGHARPPNAHRPGHGRQHHRWKCQRHRQRRPRASTAPAAVAKYVTSHLIPGRASALEQTRRQPSGASGAVVYRVPRRG